MAQVLGTVGFWMMVCGGLLVATAVVVHFSR